MKSLLCLLSLLAPSHQDSDPVPARIRAAREIDVAAEFGGLVVARPIKRNSVVKKGELILQTDTTFHELALRAAEATVAKAKAQLHFAQAERDRLEQLSKTHSVAPAEREEMEAKASIAQAELAGAHIAVKRARERLARCAVRAPADGTLIEIHPEVGEWIAPGAPAARLLTTGDLVAEAFLPAERLADFPLGAAAVVRVGAPLAESLAGRVREVAAAADERRTFRIVVEIGNPPETLRAGFSGSLLPSTGR